MGPLDGVRVLDLTMFVQGPQAAQLLADLGADVIKIELPGGGDPARGLVASESDRRSPMFYALNRGKRSVTLDLRTAAGKAVLLRLARDADVLLSNFRPGTLERWGLGYEALATLNPRLIYATGSAFGSEGPDAEREGADLNGQAAGGLLSTLGEDGSFPSPVGAFIADHSASQNLASGVLAALYARERTGRGQRVDVSLLGGQIWAQATEFTHFLLTGQVPGRANRGHPLVAGVWRVFATADGFLTIAGARPPLWAGFCRAIERPDLLDDPRFTGPGVSEAGWRELFAILEPIFRTRSTAEWCERLRAEHQRFAPLRSYAEVAADPQVWANGYLMEVEHPQWGRIAALGHPIRFSETAAKPGAVAPELGQHTEEVLIEGGFSWEEIAALRERGAW
ncbi:MAG TPA: CoA transferase [Dehalococcoidia bacterium]|nr:CoA transferase [Dehalococcoidia bacterium]